MDIDGSAPNLRLESELKRQRPFRAAVILQNGTRETVPTHQDLPDYLICYLALRIPAVAFNVPVEISTGELRRQLTSTNPHISLLYLDSPITWPSLERSSLDETRIATDS
ncbi:uncharacterized protein LAESUDRAFT_728825 [Laetiporus sulphureus 93-53]|uniref:Uncharacterized protein n=1 Tax=Laetiporus sulphureus 93-53 TaxID=1314785 RepID=A0A165CZE2_9APHY|nr:uncharacterized protein LAESUDRAFT_728825 [Laetiporus sulphureus 93-53]KZT03806.1 hypothetical protein LAESUDRAFT_728825 [Laetiporus sulphureus 93-53]